MTRTRDTRARDLKAGDHLVYSHATVVAVSERPVTNQYSNATHTDRFDITLKYDETHPSMAGVTETIVKAGGALFGVEVKLKEVRS